MDTKLSMRHISGVLIFVVCLLFSTASESHRWGHGYYGGGWGWGLGFGAAAATGLILSAPFWGGYPGYGGYYGSGYYAPRGYYRNVYYAPRCQMVKVCNHWRGRCWLERSCY